MEDVHLYGCLVGAQTCCQVLVLYVAIVDMCFSGIGLCSALFQMPPFGHVFARYKKEDTMPKWCFYNDGEF